MLFTGALEISFAVTRTVRSTTRKMRGLLRLSQQALAASRAYSSSSTPERKVAILGAAGGIGQPLALLMKVNLLHPLQKQQEMFLVHPLQYDWHSDPLALGNGSNESEPFTLWASSSTSFHLDYFTFTCHIHDSF